MVPIVKKPAKNARTATPIMHNHRKHAVFYSHCMTENPSYTVRMLPETATDILHLTKAETRVFKTLGQSRAASVADIARHSALPRMTAYDALMRLRARGLARKTGTLWKQSPPQAIHRRMTQLAADFCPSPPKQPRRTSVSAGSMNIRIVRGAKELATEYRRMYAGRPHERIQLTQFAPALAAMRRTLPIDDLKDINETGKKYKGILELLMTESTTKEYMRFLSDPTWKKSLEGRRMAIALLPETYLPMEPVEMIICRSDVMLTDWSNMTAIVIQNEAVAHMMKSFFAAASDFGTPFDMLGFLDTVERGGRGGA